MTQGELEKIPLKISRIFSDLEIRIMTDIVRRIKANGFSTASADWQITRLQQLGKSEQEIKQWIKEALDASDDEIQRIFSDEVYRQYYGHERAYKVSGFEQIPFEENKVLQQTIKAAAQQISGEYQNLASSMGFALRGADGRIWYSPLMEFYRSTLDGAVADIHSGAFDYNTVLNRVINQMTSSGVRWIDYNSGHHNRIDVAARRAIMAGFRQVQGKINEQVAAELGADSFEVTYHVGARPSHQVWQGRVWTMAQLRSVCGLGSVTGLHGANCYHDYNPFPRGSVRTYTDEQLESMIGAENMPKSYAGKEYTTYEALQQQRKMETAMRATRQKIKLLQEGGAPDGEIILQKAKYQGQMQTYKDFSEKMKLPEQIQRIMQDGLRGQFMPTKAEDRLLAQKAKYDKIIAELKASGVNGEIHYPPRMIDMNSLTFDDVHINGQRAHGVSMKEAKEYIANAKVSVTVWAGRYERYYGEAGTVYVDLANQLIRTAYKREEYKGDVLKILEVLRVNE